MANLACHTTCPTIGVHDDLHGEDAQLRWNGQVSRSPGMSATIPQKTAKEKEEEEERRNEGKTTRRNGQVCSLEIYSGQLKTGKSG